MADQWAVVKEIDRTDSPSPPSSGGWGVVSERDIAPSTPITEDVKAGKKRSLSSNPRNPKLTQESEPGTLPGKA